MEISGGGENNCHISIQVNSTTTISELKHGTFRECLIINIHKLFFKELLSSQVLWPSQPTVLGLRHSAQTKHLALKDILDCLSDSFGGVGMEPRAWHMLGRSSFWVFRYSNDKDWGNKWVGHPTKYIKYHQKLEVGALHKQDKVSYMELAGASIATAAHRLRFYSPMYNRDFLLGTGSLQSRLASKSYSSCFSLSTGLAGV